MKSIFRHTEVIRLDEELVSKTSGLQMLCGFESHRFRSLEPGRTDEDTVLNTVAPRGVTGSIHVGSAFADVSPTRERGSSAWTLAGASGSGFTNLGGRAAMSRPTAEGRLATCHPRQVDKNVLLGEQLVSKASGVGSNPTVLACSV